MKDGFISMLKQISLGSSSIFRTRYGQVVNVTGCAWIEGEKGWPRPEINCGMRIQPMTTNPQYELDVEGYVQAYGYYTGDIVFQKDV